MAPGDTSITGLTAAIVMHEFGHTFGGLADEYVTHYCSNICPGGRLSEPNVSCERMVDDSEWAHWAGAFNGAVPPSGSQNFEGAKYCIAGRFRSMSSTVMGTYPHQTNDYGPVNRESLALAVFSSVDLIDGPTPAPGRIDAPSSCADLVFRPGVPPGQALGSRGLDLQWSLDGVDHRHRSDGSWTMDRPCALPTGSYAVRLDAANNTDFVRKDPAGVTRQSFEWTVDVVNKPPALVGTPPGWTTAETADPLALDASGWFSDPEDNDLEYSWTAVPAGIVTLAPGSGGAASMTTAGPGSATVTVTASDAASGGSASQSFGVAVQPGPLEAATPGYFAGRYWPVCEASSRTFTVANPHSAKTVQVAAGSSAGAPGYTPPAPLNDDADLTVSAGPSVHFAAGGTLAFTATAAADADSVNGTRKFSFAYGGTELAAVYLREIDQGSPFWTERCQP